jgi:hypothetical protein
MMWTCPQKPDFPLQHAPFEQGISGVHDPTGRTVELSWAKMGIVNENKMSVSSPIRGAFIV